MKKQIKHKSRKINNVSFLGSNKVNKIRKSTYPKDILEVKVFQNKNNKQFNLPVMKRSTSPRIIKELLNNKNVVGLKFKVAGVVYKNKMNSPLTLSKKHYNTNLRKPLKNFPMNVAYNVSKIKQMNWKQLKRKYPNMKPTADADFDGLINMKDCKPLDPSKDGFLSKMLGRVTGDKYGQTEKEYEEEKAEEKQIKQEKKESKEYEKQQLRERKEIIAEREKEWEERDEKEEVKFEEKRIRKQIEEKGYAPTESEMKKEYKKAIGKEREEYYRDKIELFKKKMREQEKKFKPEKTLVGRLVKKALPTTTYKTIMVKGKAKRVAVITGGILPVGKQKTAIVRTAERFAGVRSPVTRVGKTAKGQKLDGAGRPKGTYKYKDPRTGEPMTAIKYHALRKKLKRQAKTVETRAEVQQRFALAKRGLSPEEVSMAREAMEEKMARLRALKEAKQMEAVEEIPEEVPEEIEEQVEEIPKQTVRRQVRPQYQRVGNQGVPPGYRLQEDLMTGKKKLVPLPQPEAWTR